MNNSVATINLTFDEDIFAEAATEWDLPRLYQNIEATTQEQFGQKRLTPVQKACLRGLLCGYSPEKIASQLPEELQGSSERLTWTLYRAIQTMTGYQPKAIESYTDIFQWLEAAGYKKTLQSNTPKLQKPDNFARSDRPRIKLPTPVSDRIPITPETENSKLDRAIEERFAPNPEPTTFVADNFQKNQSNIVVASPSLPIANENDFLPPINCWTKLGGLFIAGSVGVAIALSTFTPYKVTVQAQANIRPAGELRLVEAETEGTVVDIRVKENQSVKKGDILAIIDNSRLETRKSQLESNIQQANLQLKQIQAQITAQDHRISAETDRINRTIASAEAELSRRRREYQDRRITTTAQVTEAQANLQLAQEEWQQAQTELISAQANLKSAEAALSSAKSKQDRYQTIAASGALSQNKLEEAQLEVEQRQQEVVAQKAAVEKQKQQIARQQQAVAVAQARLENVRAALNPSDAEVAIAQETIAQEKATGQSTLANLQREKEALIQQQIEIQQQQSRDRQKLQQIEKDLHQTVIKATADGILFQLNLRNTGQTVVSGEEIAQIAPSNTSLVAKALVPAQEISQVKTGQPSQLRISACPYPDYGTLKGLVSRISPDAIAPKSNANTTSANASVSSSQNRGAAFYEVTIEPESLTVGQGNNQCPLQLGMEGRADIISDEETVLKFLLRKARLLTDF